ncbi:MAG: patatin-like phospholipase family protein [Acetobacteraceae bacterium]|nr:patatin-like phospholipase family protein [Acetobacteraceae bacterium]
MISLVLLMLVGGCAGPVRQPAVPAQLTEQVTVLGIPNARFWADTDGPAMVREAIEAMARERRAAGEAASPGQPLPPANYLALSGGSDNGAFGAGLLNGWTQTGTRPSFKLVTGISTGALIAPFAFLGPGYDQQLRQLYTGIGPRDVYERRSLYTVVFSDAFTDTAPLFQLISRYANEDMLAAIAREYARGRLLLIGTTNLDVQRPVIWNIGAIAASGKPGALDLFRKILLASASIPGAFPPVLIDVAAGGQHYQEMHVDGGAVAQVFLYPAQVGVIGNKREAFPRERHAYVIRNARLDPEWASVDRRLLSITGRAISTMIYYSGYNDVVRIYFTTQQDGVDYNLAYIGRDFTTERRQDFDRAYMQSLFDYGYRQGRFGNPWRKAPPIIEEPDGREMLSPEVTPGNKPVTSQSELSARPAQSEVRQTATN